MDDNPIKGPYPDGDSRNITLTKSDHPMEPERTGPREHENREERSETAEESDEDEQIGEPAQPYKEQSETPSAAKTAFERPTGDLEAPVLEKDWNPAERNSDDLSR